MDRMFYFIFIILSYAYSAECPLNSHAVDYQCVCNSGFYEVENDTRSIHTIDNTKCVPLAPATNNTYNDNRKTINASVVSISSSRTPARNNSLVSMYNDILSLQVTASYGNIFYSDDGVRRDFTAHLPNVGILFSILSRYPGSTGGLGASYEYTRYFSKKIVSTHSLYLGHTIYFSYGVGLILYDDMIGGTFSMYFSLPYITVLGTVIYPTANVKFGPVVGDTMDDEGILILLDIGARYEF